ncbi:LuxR C-terminal-related transcriptional regulator [Psychromonas sp. KJ10-10]|uniref:LuxR C-terminal-related transcriptional regulator n=1 Tax=Psychromonas sp. KJ10-10 TaxID=3391823 RepID=UPI0039B43309
MLEKLEQAINTRLTLVSAPAGFGKSLLIASWASSLQTQCAWLSLDSKDKNQDSFLSYLVAAIREADGSLLEEAWNIVQVPGEINSEHLITSIINELTYYPSDIILILDDYHLASCVAIDKLLNSFVDNLPANVHLILITRADPALPLAKLRTQNELIEVRSSELRFSDDEANELITLNANIHLTPDNTLTVNQKTEGWAVGLQLSALVLKSANNINEALTKFSGSHSYILDYLAEQVLDLMKNNIKHFLLETFFLKELSAEVCDYVLQRKDSAEILSFLEMNNIFIVPLDEKRGCYRYHHLFADTLSIKSNISKQRELTLNQRAAVWFAKEDRLEDSVIYARACGQDYLLEIMEQQWPSARTKSHDSLLIEWLSDIKNTMILNCPVLAGYYALALLPHNPEQGMFLLDATRDHFENANHPLTTPEKTTLGIVSIGEAYIYVAQGYSDEVLTRVRSALNVLPSSEQVWRGSSHALEGIALWRNGDIHNAEISLKVAVANMDNSDDISAKITSRFLLGDYYYQFGWLTKARLIVESAVNIVEQKNGYVVEGCADVYLLLAEIKCEQGDYDNALDLLDSAQQFGVLGAMRETKYRYPQLAGRVDLAQNKTESAMKYFSDAEAIYQETPNPCHKPPAYWKSILMLNQGNTEVFSKSPYLEQPFHIHCFSYLGYLLTLQDTNNKITNILSNASSHESSPNILFTQKMILAIKADIGADKPTAKKILEQILLLKAENDNASWLTEIKAVNTLLVKYDLVTKQATIAPAATQLIEALSTKEKQVLQWLDTELTGPQIASKLFVSLNTFRTHTKNIYSKLGVTNRRAAINQARAHHFID